MYKYYKKNNYDIMEYNFDSITEFIDYIETHKTNRLAWGSYTLSSMDNDIEFTKTKNIEEAIDKCKYGYHENFDKLIELKTKLEKYIKMSSTKLKQYNYYVGYTPDVKAYLEGSPLSMLNKENPRKKHIDIYYNSAILGRVSTSQIFNRGAITLSLVEILENMGFSVSLNIFAMSSEYKQIHYAKFNLKSPQERINIQKLYFPLCHPSFLRRLVFRLREETPDITNDWPTGYGRTCNNEMIREIIDLKENDIVICQPDEMGVQGYNIIDDANSMFKYIEEYTNDKIEIEQVKKLTR